MRRTVALWLLLFGVYAAGAGLPAAPGTDLSEPEARQLLIAESIVSDGDIDLSDEYRDHSWRSYYDGRLEPRARASTAGLLAPITPGFALLIAPVYALGGSIAVQLWLAALAAIGFVVAAALARRLVPEPWATAAALAVGLSPPAIVAATTIAPDAVGATVLAGAAALALAARERPLARLTAWAGVLLGTLPWLSLRLCAPAAVIGIGMLRWSSRRRRGVAGLVGIEVALFSLVLFISISGRLYGGLTPYAALPPGRNATGADGLAEHLERWPRLLGLLIDRDAGLLRWAPVTALALGALLLLWRSRRERLRAVISDQVDVEVAAAFLAAICAAALVVAAFLAPTIAGPWFGAHELVGVLPLIAALCAWPLRRAPRSGGLLALLTVLAGLWVLVALRVDGDSGSSPPRGSLPWGGLERVLPRGLR